ncbi:CoA-transferase family III domain-containing protein [Chaetomidium leptoderma]|uniref:CoA-transferase family III domain-containing protein n=1 Tax=Chaetomidium leptoderma TaxID=669021 RepID=A0AAN6VV40_9PEZI|nr:CoA-transferase family III domain-containing protein [Chaetomidium leptoderma]
MESTTTMASTASSMNWAFKGAADKPPLYNAGIAQASQQNILLSALRRWQHLRTVKKDREPTPQGPQSGRQHSVAAGAQEALEKLSAACRGEVPGPILTFTKTVEVASASKRGDEVHFPTPLREQEFAAAIKALEACAATAIAELRYGTESKKIRVDTDKVSAFLMSAYLTTLDGMGKPDPRIKERIPDTDLNRAQSVLYRRMSANLYATKNPGEYFHIHGSLDADVTLEMLGLPKENPDMTDYRAIIDYIGSAVKQHTAAELDALNVTHRQAGIQALTWPQFQATPHGKALLDLPPLTVRPNPSDTHSTPPTPFPPFFSSPSPSPSPRFTLAGIKVLELCRIIAGPTIGRSLAAHGAQVLKVTSPNLPDVPFFQLDVNTGKHAVHLDLHSSSSQKDRATFAALLADADVLIDGYRPGALARLGYGPAYLADLARARGKGFVYVAEDCFGGSSDGSGGSGGSDGASAEEGASAGAAEWAARPGWQQIADCVTGVAFAQGQFMGLEGEPVVPPFPMSDYGTGALGSLAALVGLYKRATEGGSWVCRTSLCQYDVFLMGLGLLPETEQARLRRVHGAGDDGPEGGFFGLRHSDSVDEVGKRALASMRAVVPHLFEDGGALMQEAWSEGFQGVLRWPREAVEIDGLRVGHVRTARPNGWDKEAGWEGWEENEISETAAETEKF